MREGMMSWAERLERNRGIAGSGGEKNPQPEKNPKQRLLSALEAFGRWQDKDFDRPNPEMAKGAEAARGEIENALKEAGPSLEELVKVCVRAGMSQAEDVLYIARLSGVRDVAAVVKIMKAVEKAEKIKFR